MSRYTIRRIGGTWWISDGDDWWLMPTQLRTGLFTMALATAILAVCATALVTVHVSLPMALALIALVAAGGLVAKLFTPSHGARKPPVGWYDAPGSGIRMWWDGAHLEEDPVERPAVTVPR